MVSARGRAALAVLVLALLVGGVSGWSLRGNGGGGGAGTGSGSGAADDATASPSADDGVVAWIDGTVQGGGDDFVLIRVMGPRGHTRVVRVEHVRWRTRPGVRLVVPPPRGLVVCAKVALGSRSVRSGDFMAGEVFEGARCSAGGAA